MSLVNPTTLPRLAPGPLNTAGGPPVRPVHHKAHRTPLACTTCRQRKTRCSGGRPTCSSCIELQLTCVYQEETSAGGGKRAGDESTVLELTRKIRVLEDKIHSLSDTLSTQSASSRGATQPAQDESAERITRPSAMSRMVQVSPERVMATQNDTTLEGEDAVDVLATAAFNDEPQMDIGCFGPSSNHALFSAISGVLIHTARICYPLDQHSMERWARSHYTRSRTRPSSPQEPRTFVGSSNEKAAVDMFVLPREQDPTMLINHFFTTIGPVLPFLSKSTFLLEYSQARRQDFNHASRDFLALLNIVLAHASSSLRTSEAEAFYRRALALLDERTLRGTSLKLIQALLLTCIFQQNTQRSVASWTLHALATKAALQLGLHSPMSYRDLAFHESEVRKRTWYGVINNDRFLSISLGRPCLVSPQHVRIESLQAGLSIPRTRSMVPLDLTDGLVYFNHLTSLCAIASSTIGLLYDHNVDISTVLDPQELVVSRSRLAWQLKKWCQSLSPMPDIISANEMKQLGPASIDAKRFQILLSIQYHRMILLINWPMLTAFLNLATTERQSELEFEILLEAVAPVIRNDLIATTELLGIIQTITLSAETFLDRNAAWWTCSYTMFTVSLHLFGILLACKHQSTLLSASSVAETRTLLSNSIDTMRALERTSLMSRKARKGLVGLLEVFDSFTSDQLYTPSVENTAEVNAAGQVDQPMFSFVPTAEEYVSQYIASSTNEFLYQNSHNDFLQTGFDALY